MYEDEKIYYLVNPKGAIHDVPSTLAKQRLAQIGWRLATKEEIRKLFAKNGSQRAGKPICKPWTPEPPLEQEIPEQEAPKKKDSPKKKDE